MRNILKYINFILIILIVFSFEACKEKQTNEVSVFPIEADAIRAEIETSPITAGKSEDAADDPAIWINKADPAQSLIVGSNKKAGINLYNLSGQELFFIDAGSINNVDLRYGFDLNGTKVDLVGGSNRTHNSISLFFIDGVNNQLLTAHSKTIVSDVDVVYGFCMYQSKQSGNFYAFVNGKNGYIEQWLLEATENDMVDAQKVRTINVDTQPEGMVADDELGFLYVGEENKGVWKFNAEPDASSEKTFLAMSDESNPAIEYDIEGMAILYQPKGKGYLFVSSQGNNSYAVFARENNNQYLTSFAIEDGEIDAVDGTDGLDITHFALNETFPAGCLIVQDGHNYDGDTLLSQNFKLVDFRKIAWLLAPEQELNYSYNPFSGF